ncbi:MAG: polysaccharide deacetylase family protein [Cyanobacteriota bacterium]|nr:polysaccharide deacetylase family protein [Cyanobacteriota bacterium]
MAQHHSWAWQRRTLLALTIAAFSYALGLLWPLKSADRFKTTEQISQTIAGANPIDGAQRGGEEELTLSDARVLKNFAARIARLEAQQNQIYNYSLPQQFQGTTIQSISLPGNQKAIALTFDDGPWPTGTNDILYILKKNNIKATFFLLGRNVQNFPNLAKTIVNHGHVVANHSWSHPYHQHSQAAAARELDRTDEIIYETTGVKSVLFRPPGGYLNNGLAAYAASQKNTVVMWSADSQDYRASSSQQIRNVLANAGQGGIVLMHDGGGDRRRTVNALPIIIEKLKEQGYTFVTLPELMEMQAQAAQATKVQEQSPAQ